MNAPTLHEDLIGCYGRHEVGSGPGLGRPSRWERRWVKSVFLATATVLAVAVGLADVGLGESVEMNVPPDSGLDGSGYEMADGVVVTDQATEPLAGYTQLGDCETCRTERCGSICDRCCPKWQIQVDALMLWQGAIPNRPLYLDSETRTSVINANDLQTPMTIDPRYAILYNFDDCRAVEVNYFNLWGFEGEAAAPRNTGAYEMNDLAGLNFSDIDVAAAQSQASIKSLECNFRRRGWGDVQWISGFRWLEWNQQLAMADVYTLPEPGSDAIGVGTRNNLYGWQWGGDLTLWNRGERLRVNGIAKGGVYYNHQAGQVTSYVTNRATPTSIGDADDTVAFVGETGIMASYSLTKWLAIRMGYTFFWLGGVATPAEQLASTTVDPNLTPEATVSPYGSAFLQGVQTGVEARW
ncbi:MAG: hypothetical protein ACKOEM_04280 [Planctomycetia bacterium]